MRIRRMTKEDLDQVILLERQIFPDPWSQKSFEYEVAQNAFGIPLILETKQNIIGYAIIWRIYEEFHIGN